MANLLDNYKLFVGQEDIKRIIEDILYDMDGIVVHLNKMEPYIISDSDTDLEEPQNDKVVINATPLNMANAPPSPNLSVIILDD